MKEELIDKIIREVKGINISEIIGSDIRLKKSGNNFDGVCPFHNDHKIGSFKVNDQKGIFKCFACGVGGDSIKYYASRKGLNYIESAIELSFMFSIITLEEYNYLKSKRFTKKDSDVIEKMYIEKAIKDYRKKIATIDILDKVYSILSKKGQSLSEKLSLEHYNHLKDERKLSEEEIIDGGYFTMPSRKNLKSILAEIENKFNGLDVLKEVPGFFYDEKKENFSFVYMKGIGIPVRDYKGQISGIQVRKDNVEEKTNKDGTVSKTSRYIWFSSDFMNAKEGYKYGTGTISPCDVVYPKEIKGKTIFITEGRFKAQAIAKEFNSIAISIQGVTTWRSLVFDIEEIVSYFNLNNLFVTFDADMAYNPAVYRQALNMTNELSKYFKNVYYVMWDVDDGKGIDDLINSCTSTSAINEKIDKMNKEEFDTHYNKFMKKIYDKYKTQNNKILATNEEIKDCFDSIVLSNFNKFAV